MSQSTGMTVAGKHPWVSVVETLAGTYLQHEQIRNGIPLGYNGAPNTADAYPKVTTGVDYDGTTLRQIVPGVDNQQLAVGVGGLLVLGIVVYALTR